MKRAFMLLGLLGAIVYGGAFLALERHQEASTGPAPTSTTEEAAPVIIRDNPETMSLTLTSPAFANGEMIPQKYTCDGENVSPELHISNAPEGTRSFILVMDDPDIPVSVKQARGIDTFDHWVVFNIPGDTTVIPEGGLQEATTGMNTRGTNGYTGPCPPDKEHRYFFRLYAVSGILNFIKAPTLHEVEAAAQGMSLGEATLTGRYERARE